MYQIAKFNQKKMVKRRRKLRSLVRRETVDTKSNHSLVLTIFTTFFLAGLIFTIYYVGTTIVWGDFLTTYRNQYNQIVHGEKDYCLSVIDTAKLFSDIRNQVLNQEAALASIELQLRNNSKFTAIAVVGPSGVGKSLFVQMLKEHFPWPENTQIFSWSDFRSIEQKQEDVLLFLNYLSECGRNLIVIDNLRSDDLKFVQEYSKYSLKRVEESKANVILLYIFSVPAYTDEQLQRYEDEIANYDQLKDAQLVKFRKFDSNDLADCIRHESNNLNLTLDPVGFEEVFKSIDAERSGCKNVHSKVLMYGRVREY